MGANQSNHRIYQRLYHVIHHLEHHGWEGPGWFDKSSKPFASTQDRDQFIYATITVLSQNGAINLDHHTFRLLFTRRENERLVARLIAEREGVVVAQIEPTHDGKDQAEAFRALRRHVEIVLDQMLRDVPGALGGDLIAGPSLIKTASAPVSPGGRASSGGSAPATGPQGLSSNGGLPLDAPPAYGKAVKDWKAGTDSKRG